MFDEAKRVIMIIRPPAVAGTLYDADTQRLLAQVESWLNEGVAKTTPKTPKALVVPHSGYHYSGKTAAAAYRLLEPVYDSIRRVVILGNSHRDTINGFALPGVDVFKTPLGDVKVDPHAVQHLLNEPDVQELPEAHRLEHSIEVQLPFLQTVLEDFVIVPLIVGNNDPKRVAELLKPLWGAEETLIVISTGLSRKRPQSEARSQDAHSAERIRKMKIDFSYPEACGFNALNGFLYLAKEKHLDSKCLALSTSADTNGLKDRVRGFGSFAFF